MRRTEEVQGVLGWELVPLPSSHYIIHPAFPRSLPQPHHHPRRVRGPPPPVVSDLPGLPILREQGLKAIFTPSCFRKPFQ